MNDDKPPIPSGAIERALKKCLGTCNSTLPQLEYFEELAKVDPALDPLVTQLRIKWEHLDRLARTGLNIKRDENRDKGMEIA
jgi:hypothetical protein